MNFLRISSWLILPRRLPCGAGAPAARPLSARSPLRRTPRHPLCLPSLPRLSPARACPRPAGSAPARLPPRSRPPGRPLHPPSLARPSPERRHGHDTAPPPAPPAQARRPPRPLPVPRPARQRSAPIGSPDRRLALLAAAHANHRPAGLRGSARWAPRLAPLCRPPPVSRGWDRPKGASRSAGRNHLAREGGSRAERSAVSPGCSTMGGGGCPRRRAGRRRHVGTCSRDSAAPRGRGLPQHRTEKPGSGGSRPGGKPRAVGSAGGPCGGRAECGDGDSGQRAGRWRDRDGRGHLAGDRSSRICMYEYICVCVFLYINYIYIYM